ncbi:MAG: helix-turn-helix domain-containing protein [Kiritimatiellae bacterium]|nr:helix-turn-helix domain-containing protein [Kiritimatiellia bacterium]MDD5520805.1 helix-turn-helix domain-containing protein [Kiritimatiellia bacterium]
MPTENECKNIGSPLKTSESNVGGRIQILRKRYGLSIRDLAKRADVSPAMISYVERGVNSLSLVTLQKVLAALGTSIADFFSDKKSDVEGPVFVREQMRVISDAERTYTILFDRRKDVQLEMFDEHFRPSKKKPKYEMLSCDIAGYVLSGSLVLDVKGKKERTLRTGDAFYVAKGTVHRGYTVGGDEARLITAYYPASY